MKYSNEVIKIKRIELDIFNSFIYCCNQLNIKYYLLGGSMLGAVRHKGFIPWDDDIDVGLYRTDYEKFISEAQKYLPDYYFVQSRKTEPEYLNNFAKLRDSRTTFIETSVKDRNINHGIYIDIFPLDYYPEKQINQIEFDLKNKLLSLRIREAFVLSKNNRHNFVLECIAKTISKIMSLKYKTINQALDARETLYKSVPQTDLIANYCGAWGKKEIVPSYWYGEGINSTFEGLEVRIPTEYDKWLTQVYGDYMKLPPEEKRVTHHFTEVIDTEKSYTEYLLSNENKK